MAWRFVWEDTKSYAEPPTSFQALPPDRLIQRAPLGDIQYCLILPGQAQRANADRKHDMSSEASVPYHPCLNFPSFCKQLNRRQSSVAGSDLCLCGCNCDGRGSAVDRALHSLSLRGIADDDHGCAASFAGFCRGQTGQALDGSRLCCWAPNTDGPEQLRWCLAVVQLGVQRGSCCHF